MPSSARAAAKKSDLLILTKSNTKSRIHRPAYTDYIGIKRLNKETINGLKSTLVDILEDCEITMNLTIISRTDYPTRGVLSQFEAVKFIDK